MITDTCTFIWDSYEQIGPLLAGQLNDRGTPAWDRIDASTSAHDQAMAPVERVFVLGLESRLLGVSIRAGRVAGYVARRPDKYIGFGGVDVADDRAAAQFDETLKCRLAGVVVSPAAGRFHPCDMRAMALYEKCQRSNLAVIVLTAAAWSPRTVLELSQPHLFDEVARAFPAMRILITGMGEPWIEQTVTMLAKHRNIYTDVSGLAGRPWRLYHALRMAYEHRVIDRILLGSDFPFAMPEQVLTSLVRVNDLTTGTGLPVVPAPDLRAIVTRDAVQCLGITPPPPGSDVSRAAPAAVESDPAFTR